MKISTRRNIEISTPASLLWLLIPEKVQGKEICMWIAKEPSIHLESYNECHNFNHFYKIPMPLTCQFKNTKWPDGSADKVQSFIFFLQKTHLSFLYQINRLQIVTWETGKTIIIVQWLIFQKDFKFISMYISTIMER